MNNVSYHIAFAKTLAFIFTQYAIFKIENNLFFGTIIMIMNAFLNW